MPANTLLEALQMLRNGVCPGCDQQAKVLKKKLSNGFKLYSTCGKPGCAGHLAGLKKKSGFHTKAKKC